MFAIFAAVIGHIGLGTWNSIGSILGGAIALVLFVFGVSRAIWLWWHRPKLVLEYGNGPEFDRRISISSPDLGYFAGGKEIEAAFAKVMIVRETKGNLAREVAVRVIDVDTPGTPKGLPHLLQWLHSFDETSDIQPRGYRKIIFQRLMFTLADEGRYVNTQSPLDNATPQVATIEILVRGKRHRTDRIRVDHSWPGLQIGFLGEGDPLPDPMPYPMLSEAAKERRFASLRRGGDPA